MTCVRRRGSGQLHVRRGRDHGMCLCTLRWLPGTEGVRADPALGKRVRPRLQRAEDPPGCVGG